jgi:hypothetical protein
VGVRTARHARALPSDHVVHLQNSAVMNQNFANLQKGAKVALGQDAPALILSQLMPPGARTGRHAKVLPLESVVVLASTAVGRTL